MPYPTAKGLSSEVAKPASHSSPALPHFPRLPVQRFPPLQAAGILPHRVTRGQAGSYSLQRVTEPALFPHSSTPSDDAAGPTTRRAVACHSLQSPCKLTSLRYKELIVFHALCRLTKHTLMMSIQTDSLAPQLGYCFYSAI